MFDQAKAKAIWALIKSQKKVVLCTHIDADGDTIGTALALKGIILANSNVQEVKISGENYPRYLNFLAPPDLVSDYFFNKSLKVVVDTSTKARIFDKRLETEKAVKIDHHHPEQKWLLEIGDDRWPATGQLLWEMATFLNLTIPQKAREAIFVAIWTDTEGLSQRNVSDATREVLTSLKINQEAMLQKMKLTKKELEQIDLLSQKIVIRQNIASLLTDFVVPNDYIRQMTGFFSSQKSFEVYFGVTKVKKGLYRGELRSKGKVDVSKIAKSFGGGGHFSSAGFKVTSLAKARTFLRQLEQSMG